MVIAMRSSKVSTGKKVGEDARPSPLTQSDMVLIAFYRASKGSTTKVPYEELVLQSWKDFPEAFSLRNHPEHPDASDIHKKLYQTLRPAGLVLSLGNKIFRLTDKGVDRALELVALREGQPAATSTESVRLSRSEENFVKHALQSRVLAAWRQGEGDLLVDYDARTFFQFSTSTGGSDRQQRVAAAREAIAKARVLGVEGADEIGSLSEHLIGRFSHLMEV